MKRRQRPYFPRGATQLSGLGKITRSTMPPEPRDHGSLALVCYESKCLAKNRKSCAFLEIYQLVVGVRASRRASS